jgi:hypothetical protein
MKQLARKIRSLSIVQPAKEPVHPASEPGLSNLRDAFDGWLNSVKPLVRQNDSLTAKSSETSPRRRPVTSRDIVRVNRATVRESNDHRHWPPEVVQRFLAANVIKRKS